MPKTPLKSKPTSTTTAYPLRLSSDLYARIVRMADWERRSVADFLREAAERALIEGENKIPKNF